MLEVVEKFVSINGEGAHAGEIAVFIRFKNCNLSCPYCDTKWASRGVTQSEFFTAEQLAQWIFEHDIRNVTLTGGEPLLQKDLPELVDLLTQNNHRVEIETNGSIALDEYAALPNRPVFTMDYKLPSSHMDRFMQCDNFALLKPNDTVKFVAGSDEDLNAALDVIQKYRLTEKCHVYFSAVFGKIESARIVEFMINHGLNDVRLQLQMHKFIWEPSRRGV